MPRDNRQIQLDPMEWRDAMKDVATPKKKTPKPKRSPKKTKDRK